MTTDEFGQDLEHVEVLQRKFDEFQKDMASQEYRVTEVNELADRLVLDGHPERDTILKRKEVYFHYHIVLKYWYCNIHSNLFHCIFVGIIGQRYLKHDFPMI